MVKKYVDVHKKDFDRVLNTEKRFEFVIGNAMISGDIDLIKKTNENGKITSIEIIDFKTALLLIISVFPDPGHATILKCPLL